MSRQISKIGPDILLPAAQLPLSQLESLKFKANQIIESIQALQWTLSGAANPATMPAWPDILSKYNLLLSQTHNFSNALVNPFPSAGAGNAAHGRTQISGGENIFQKIVMHPNMGMSDLQLDSEVGQLLRNQQTLDVLKQENETVRRLSEDMATRGMLGVMGITPSASTSTQTYQPHSNGYGGLFAAPQRKPEYEDVLRECAEIKDAHDRRVDRAVRAVTMLREKFDWKQRVEVEVEEPEELDWDPRLGPRPLPGEGTASANQAAVGGGGDATMESDSDGNDGDGGDADDKGGSSDEDEVNVEGELVDDLGDMDVHTPTSDGIFGPETDEGGGDGMVGIL